MVGEGGEGIREALQSVHSAGKQSPLLQSENVAPGVPARSVMTPPRRRCYMAVTSPDRQNSLKIETVPFRILHT